MEKQSTRKLFKLMIVVVSVLTLCMGTFLLTSCSEEPPVESIVKEATCGTEGLKTFTDADGVVVNQIAIQPTGTNHNVVDGYCTVCGIPQAKIGTVNAEAGHVHTYALKENVTVSCGAGSCTEIWACACGASYGVGKAGVTIEADHAWGAEQVKAATCTEDGYKFQVCEKCGAEKKGDAVASTGHTWGTEVGEVAPSCVANGYTFKTCTECGIEQTVGTIESEGHWYYNITREEAAELQEANGWTDEKLVNELGAYANISAPSNVCLADRVSYVECLYCGDKSPYGDIVDAPGHTWVDVTTTAATCTTAGFNAYSYCSTCGYYALGNSVDAFCGDYILNDDGARIVCDLTAIDHAEVNEAPTVKQAALGHTFDVENALYTVSVSPDADCFTAAYTVSVCTVCYAEKGFVKDDASYEPTAAHLENYVQNQEAGNAVLNAAIGTLVTDKAYSGYNYTAGKKEDILGHNKLYVTFNEAKEEVTCNIDVTLTEILASWKAGTTVAANKDYADVIEFVNAQINAGVAAPANITDVYAWCDRDNCPCKDPATTAAEGYTGGFFKATQHVVQLYKFVSQDVITSTPTFVNGGKDIFEKDADGNLIVYNMADWDLGDEIDTTNLYCLQGLYDIFEGQFKDNEDYAQYRTKYAANKDDAVQAIKPGTESAFSCWFAELCAENAVCGYRGVAAPHAQPTGSYLQNCQHGDLCPVCETELTKRSDHKLINISSTELDDAQKAYVAKLAEVAATDESGVYSWYKEAADATCYETGTAVYVCSGCLEALYANKEVTWTAIPAAGWTDETAEYSVGNYFVETLEVEQHAYTVNASNIELVKVEAIKAGVEIADNATVAEVIAAINAAKLTIEDDGVNVTVNINSDGIFAVKYDFNSGLVYGDGTISGCLNGWYVKDYCVTCALAEIVQVNIAKGTDKQPGYVADAESGYIENAGWYEFVAPHAHNLAAHKTYETSKTYEAPTTEHAAHMAFVCLECGITITGYYDEMVADATKYVIHETQAEIEAYVQAHSESAKYLTEVKEIIASDMIKA